jgi:DNA polymerase sigma
LQDAYRKGEQVGHLGSMLLSFLRRFGVDFDLDEQAVAVRSGGFVKKGSLGPSFQRKGMLALEDPLTGAQTDMAKQCVCLQQCVVCYQLHHCMSSC